MESVDEEGSRGVPVVTIFSTATTKTLFSILCSFLQLYLRLTLVAGSRYWVLTSRPPRVMMISEVRSVLRVVTVVLKQYKYKYDI
jgi:hypothetical protein